MMQKLKSKLTKSIKNKKLNVFALFFLLALFFLIITKLSNTYTETIELNIVLKNRPLEHKVVDGSTQKATMVVETHGFKLVSYNLFKPQLIIDFKTDITLKGDSYIWTSKMAMPNIKASLGKSVNILSIQPDSLIFSFEKMTVKKVPVRLKSNFKMLSGYDISGDIKIAPDSITIVGSEKQVSKITSITTKILDLKDVHSSFNQSIEIQNNEDLKKLSLSHKNIKISAKVEKFTEGVFDIPVTISNLPESTQINYFPKTISVVYYVSLANYKYIKPTDFRIECDYKTILNSEQSFLTPKLTKYPGQIKSARLKQNKVEFILIQ
jgi:hypothetical protein